MVAEGRPVPGELRDDATIRIQGHTLVVIVPVRLDACPLPRAVHTEFQWLDFFPDWDRGLALLKAMMRREMARRKP